ncbi:hypothetical protein POM88_024959 [Heracleum sosnowskyi]|uniref:F-box protein n=1 Tax=Heracleum sosnowskyi TaxID=360622 RepID=A0AAD8I424_9APIA|nr:hypothetical protein POM88_024959 [Heracleum sosnowskyi]
MVWSAQETETDEKKKIETAPGQWSQLQTDLLKEIAGRLYFCDYIRFYAVCKNWLATKNYQTPAAYSLPWLVKIPFCTNNLVECQLYEPFSRNPKPTQVIEIPLHLDDKSCDSVDIDIRYKFGWLLLSVSNKHSSAYTDFTLFVMETKNGLLKHCGEDITVSWAMMRFVYGEFFILLLMAGKWRLMILLVGYGGMSVN